MGEPAVQCEDCGGLIRESVAELVEYPGATLAFCPDCAAPTRAEEVGL